MKHLAAAALLVLAGFAAGAIAMLELVDRLFGGRGVQVDVDDEPGGGWDGWLHPQDPGYPFEELQPADTEAIPVIELGRPMEIRWSEGEWTRGVLGGIGWDRVHEAYRISLRGVERSSDRAELGADA